METTNKNKIRVYEVFEGGPEAPPYVLPGRNGRILYIPSEPPGLPDWYVISRTKSKKEVHKQLCRAMIKLHQYSYQNRKKVNYYWRRRYPIAYVISRFDFDPWVKPDEWKCSNFCRGKANEIKSLRYDEFCGECFADVTKSVYSWSGIEDWDLETVDETEFVVLTRFMIRAKYNWRHSAAWLYWDGDTYSCYVYDHKNIHAKDLLKTVERVLAKLGI